MELNKNSISNIKEVLEKRELDNKKEEKLNIDNDSLSDFSLKENFIPQSYSDEMAVKISKALKDTGNFAFYRHIVFDLGVDRAKEALEKTKWIVERARRSSDPIRNSRALFNAICQRSLQKEEQT